ncbi:MAG TPA: serine/threonine-protein kinase [Candidatus Sulfotelmatobacter sp.]|nr:serine/threonine-protein kinase [Candidatus Sulfotelmatobacter sp.]
MTPERWQQISEALDHALRLSPEQRHTYLAGLAQKDPELRQEVESLLASHREAETDFLNTPFSHSLLDAAQIAPSIPLLGKRVGVYQIIARIGEGGMGEVYRAIRADDQFHKQVALKVVRRGHDSGFVLSRFRNERQILATLDHPNIARLLDGGTTEDGVPYFVMELIEGDPIDQYCERHKLSTAERLKLFLNVCSAVQYAHQRLIVHRDLKPGNILVASDGTPKLLDFGIAKILDPEDFSGPMEPTLTVFRVLTPGYASPEQIRGEPITTATDVYSLGVILFELLTGASPYRVTRSAQELARAVCESEPERPSTAVRRSAAQDSSPAGDANRSDHDDSSAKRGRRLSGDLDNIVLMALRKEPERRYLSVEQFGEDIRRHLENLPVIARKDTARYRASKFVARHRGAVVGAIATTTILLLALVVTFREARIAERQAALARAERTRAERRFNDVRKLANSLMFEVHDSIQDLPGATKARKLIVTRALEYLDSLSQEAADDPSLQRELAAAYDRVGDVLGYTGQAYLGDFAGAAQSYQKALAIRETLAAANPSDLQVQAELADEYFRAAGLQQDTGDFDGALHTLQRAQPFIERISSEAPDQQMLNRIAGLYWFRGTVFEKKKDFAAALENYRRGASIREPFASDPNANVITRAHLVADYNGVAKMMGETGQIDDAIKMAAKATGLMKQLSDANPSNATFREWLGESYGIWADQLKRKADLDGALSLQQRAHDIFSQLNAADPNNRLAADNLAFTKLAMERILIQQGKTQRGIHLARAALVLFEPRGAKDLWNETGASMSYYDMGTAYAALAARSTSTADQAAEWREARSWYQKADEVWKLSPEKARSDALGQDQESLIEKGIAASEAKLRDLSLKARNQPR